ncbi:phosphate transporter (Pho88) [Lithohypha guttulata]|nr:phosphate transporter (Pho88) [Lithohypha guttulata]
MVNPQITNLVIMLGMMQVSKKIPFEDPNVLMGVRALYVVSNLLIFGVYYYITTKIQRKKGKELEGGGLSSYVLVLLLYNREATPDISANRVRTWLRILQT